MIESEKRLRELGRKLNDKNPENVSSAIILLRDEEPFCGAVSLLIEVFDKTVDQSIKVLIRNFMNDMKELGARSEIISEIRKPHKTETTVMLISSCWQSGLDYSPFTEDLLRVFLEGDYIVSLECLTVIEESLHNITRKRKSEMIGYLEENRRATIDEKSPLVNELISILR